MEIFNFIIFILYELLKYSEFLYKNFSFPLFLLIVILVFRKEISNLLNRIRQINIENNAGKVSISLAEINRLKSEMEHLKIIKFVNWVEKIQEIMFI